MLFVHPPSTLLFGSSTSGEGTARDEPFCRRIAVVWRTMVDTGTYAKYFQPVDRPPWVISAMQQYPVTAVLAGVRQVTSFDTPGLGRSRCSGSPRKVNLSSHRQHHLPSIRAREIPHQEDAPTRTKIAVMQSHKVLGHGTYTHMESAAPGITNSTSNTTCHG